MRPPKGHMVINMKTTVTTHGAHSGYIVHSGIASNQNNNGPNSWSSPNFSPSSSQLNASSGSNRLALEMGPSTSQEHLADSWRDLRSIDAAERQLASSRQNLSANRSPVPPTSRYEHFEPPSRSPLPSTTRYEPYEQTVRSQQPPTYEPYEETSRSPLPSKSNYEQIDRNWRRPATPPSPVFDFSGRESPPDEFIEPSKITLNVFDPGVRTPVPYEVGLRKTDISTADALINDTVTTTTTVEVFRTPLDPSNPNKVVALPPPPAPGIDDRPQLLRINGPPYERWTNSRQETLLNDRPVQSNKGVQWKDGLIESNQQNQGYDPYSGARSPFANATQPPGPPSSRHQYYVPTVHSVDQRLLQDDRSVGSPLVQSPSEFTQSSQHQSRENVNRSPYPEERYRTDSRVSYEAAPRAQSSPASYAQVRQNRPRPSDTPILSRSPQQSPAYVAPDRRNSQVLNRSYEKQDRYRAESPQQARRDSRGDYDRQEKRREREDYRADSRHHEKRRDYSPSSRTSRRDRNYDARDSSPPRRGRNYDARDNSPPPHRRSHSSRRSRRKEREDRYRHRSESPAFQSQRQGAEPNLRPAISPKGAGPNSRSVSLERPDPNSIGGVSRASSRDIFTLYQTRDALDNIVAQFQELDFGLSEATFLSPLANSEDSLISATSPRNDYSKCDFLEITKNPRSSSSSQLDRSFQLLSPDSLLFNTMRASSRSTEHIYESPKEREHIYEELDSVRSRSLERPSRNSTNHRRSPRQAPPILPRPRPISCERMNYHTTEEHFEEVTTTRLLKPKSPKKQKPAPPPRTTPIKYFNQPASRSKYATPTPKESIYATPNTHGPTTRPSELSNYATPTSVEQLNWPPPPSIPLPTPPANGSRTPSPETDQSEMSYPDPPTFLRFPSKIEEKTHTINETKGTKDSSPKSSYPKSRTNHIYDYPPEEGETSGSAYPEAPSSILQPTSCESQPSAPVKEDQKLQKRANIEENGPTKPSPAHPESGSTKPDPGPKPHAPIRSPGTIRKAHPYEIFFPRLTSKVPILPQLPEEKEVSARTQSAPSSPGIRLAYSPCIPFMDDSPRSIQRAESIYDARREESEGAGPSFAEPVTIMDDIELPKLAANQSREEEEKMEEDQQSRQEHAEKREELTCKEDTEKEVEPSLESKLFQVTSDSHRLIIKDWEQLISSDSSEPGEE